MAVAGRFRCQSSEVEVEIRVSSPELELALDSAFGLAADTDAAAGLRVRIKQNLPCISCWNVRVSRPTTLIRQAAKDVAVARVNAER